MSTGCTQWKLCDRSRKILINLSSFNEASRGELSLDDRSRQIAHALLINHSNLLDMLSKKLLRVCPQI